MPEALKVVLSLSLSGSLLILVLLAARPLLRGFGKRWQYYLWLLVVARLLIPWTPETSLVGGLFRYAADTTALQEAAAQSPDSPPGGYDLPDTETGTAPPAAALPGGSDEPLPAPAAGETVGAFSLWSLWLLWPAGALALLVYKIATYRSFVRYVRAGSREVTDPALLDRFSDLCGEAGVHRPVELCRNSLIASPLLLGLRRPCVVLPETGWGESSLEYIVLHEMTHHRRRDILYKWLVQLVLCVHWFNPLVHLMARQVNRACELACDEAILARVGEERHKAYGDTLLDTLRVPGTYRESVAALTLGESAEQLKERLEAILSYKRHPHWKAGASAALTFALFAFAAFSGAYYVTATGPETGAAARTPESVPAQAGTFDSTESRTVSNTYTISSYANDDLNDFDRRGIEIMQYSGTWGETMEEVLPHMTDRGIDIAVGIYNDKHPVHQHKTPADYYNYAGAGGAGASAAAITSTGGRAVSLAGQTVSRLEILVSMGAVRIEPGDSLKLYFGPKIQQYMDHSVENGVLLVWDTYDGKNQSIRDWRDADYEIVLTVPRAGRSFDSVRVINDMGSLSVYGIDAGDFQVGGMMRSTFSNLTASAMAVNSSVGEVAVTSCKVAGSFTYRGEVSGLTVDTLSAGSLSIETDVGSVTATGVSVSGPAKLRVDVGSVHLTGSLAGDIHLVNNGVGNIRLDLKNRRADYAVTATNSEPDGDWYDRPSFTINGTEYGYNYSEETTAPHRITIESHNGFGEMVGINFAR